MQTTLTGTFLKASDGTAATGMDVDIVTPWSLVGAGNQVSYQLGWGAGPNAGESGGWKMQFSNDPTAGGTAAGGIGARATDYPGDMLGGPPSQPDSSAGNTILSCESIGRYSRAYYVAGTGGTGVLPVGDMESARFDQ